MMAQLQRELIEKEEALANIQATIQETKEAKKTYIATIEASTMTWTTLVISHSLDIP